MSRRTVPAVLGLALALALSAGAIALAAKAVVPTDGRYTGLTSQVSAERVRGSVAFNVSGRPGKQRISAGQIAVTYACTRSGEYKQTITMAPFAVTKAGRFRSHARFTVRFSDGPTGLVLTQVAGRFTDRRHAKGTFSASMAVSDPQGVASDTCDTHTLTFQAAR